MDYYGVIRAMPNGTPLSYEVWCAFISCRTDLVRAKPIVGQNPKTGEPMVFPPRPDGATIMVNGENIGTVGWSPLGQDEVVVIGDPVHVIPWAHALARELDAEFVELPAERHR